MESQQMGSRYITGLGKLTLAASVATIGLAWLATPSRAQVSVIVQTQTPGIYRTPVYQTNYQSGNQTPGIIYHNNYQRPNPYIYIGAPRTIVQPVQVISPIANPTFVNPVIVGSPVVNSTLINPTLINSPVQSSTVIVTPGYQSVPTYYQPAPTYYQPAPTYGVTPGIITYPNTTSRTSISISF